MDMQKTPASARSRIPKKKLSSILRVLLIMVKKGISKTKLGLELNLMLKKGNKLAGKAIGNLLMLHHHHHQSSSNDAVPFFFRRNNDEYEFSYSSTPNYFLHPAAMKRNSKLFGGHKNTDNINQLEEDAATVAAVQRVLEMLDNNDDVSTGPKADPISPPLVHLPVSRQLRITDSPFPKEDGDLSSAKVNEEADEFIRNFYTNLMKQNSN